MVNILLAGVDLNVILTQAIGVVAICFAIFSFQAKKRASILLFQTIASTLWMIHFILLNAYTGAILNFIIVLRNLVYFFRGKYKWADSIAWIFVFSIAIIAVSIFTWDGAISLLPMVGSILTTASFYMSDPQKLRILTLTASPLWLVYDAVSRSIPGTANEVFVMTSIIIALIRYSKKITDKTVAKADEKIVATKTDENVAATKAD